MNLRTLAIASLEDLMVIKVRFGIGQVYTYVARSIQKDLIDLDQDDKLIVSVRDGASIVNFVEYGDLADLDLDNEEIKYRFVIGRVPEYLLIDNKITEEMLAERIKQLQIKQLKKRIKRLT